MAWYPARESDRHGCASLSTVLPLQWKALDFFAHSRRDKLGVHFGGLETATSASNGSRLSAAGAGAACRSVGAGAHCPIPPDDEPHFARRGPPIGLSPSLRRGKFHTEEPVKQPKDHRPPAYGSNPHAFGAEPCPSKVPYFRTPQVSDAVDVRDLPSVQCGERHGTGQVAAIDIAEFGCQTGREVCKIALHGGPARAGAFD